MICREWSTEGTELYEPCPVCLHTIFVHPNKMNPTLTGCAICILVYKEVLPNG